jgi:hypothetical protein
MSSGVMTDLLAYWPFVRDVPSSQSTAAVGSPASALDGSLRTAARGAAPRLVDGVTPAAGGASDSPGRGVATSPFARSAPPISLLAFVASACAGAGVLLGGTRVASGADMRAAAGAGVVPLGTDMRAASGTGGGAVGGGMRTAAGAGVAVLGGGAAVGCGAGVALTGITGVAAAGAPRLLDDARCTAAKARTPPAASTRTLDPMTTSRRWRRERCSARTRARRSNLRSAASVAPESVALGPGIVANLLPRLDLRVCPRRPEASPNPEFRQSSTKLTDRFCCQT